MTTIIQKNHINAFRTEVESFNRKLDSFVQMVSPIQSGDISNERKEGSKEDPITEKQLALLQSLIIQNVHDRDQREKWLNSLHEETKKSASDQIESFIESTTRVKRKWQ